MKISKTKKNWKSLDRIQKRNKSARIPGRDEKLLEQVKELALKENIRLAAVQALGATNSFTVGVIRKAAAHCLHSGLLLIVSPAGCRAPCRGRRGRSIPAG